LRIAAIDIGSNSIHMVIAESHHPPAFEVVDREREVVQIGRGSFGDGRLRRDAMQRTVLALRRFVQLARRMQVDRILCTATAAVRESANGGEFLQMCRELVGITPRVIPAAEEGRIIDLAIRSALRMQSERALVLDIGGGSAQLVSSDGSGTPLVASVPLGALRLTELYVENDPATPREITRLRRVIRDELRGAFRRMGDNAGSEVYGASGSVHALAHAAHWFERGERLRQINGYVLTLDALRRTVRKLMSMPRAQREKLPEVDALRAEIIVPGALVLLEVLERAGAGAITVSDFGLREGLVTDWLQRHTQEVSVLDKVDDLRLRSVLALLAKFGPSGPHPQHVADLSLAMFDGLAREHGIDAGGRELLRFAALLHDAGSAIGYDGHAEHSRYVIQYGNLRGLSEKDVEIIANVARYHGKARPRKRDEGYRRLDKSSRRLVRWLSAMLRIAEGLDRSHYQLIRGLRVVRRAGGVSIVVSTRRDAHHELWAARRRVGRLAKLLGAGVRIAEAARPERRASAPVSRPRLPAAAASESARSRRAAAVPPARRPSRVPPPAPGSAVRTRAVRAAAGSRATLPDRAPLPALAAVRVPKH
jgi:exopolyphosphatase/guanosine-5'-triphosphate,3'-diphosphate pyrophosphatase